MSSGGSSTLTVGNPNTSDPNPTAPSGTFGGVIQNATGSTLSLTKIGPGTQTLSGANTYSGTTDS